MTCHHEHPAIDPDTEIFPHGLIVMDKPPGPTGFDCIRHLRKTCNVPKKWKIGHLGTLDPFASGIMVIALGQAVRYSEYGLKSNKKYRARLWLGDETDTLDPTGEIINSASVPSDWQKMLPGISSDLTGKIMQTPPQYSAKQVSGKRSYKAARQGVNLDLAPVEVEIFSLEFGHAEENWVDFTAHVSGGTYIRSLGRDIAYKLGTVGHLLGLERTASGRFPIEEAIPFRAFEVGGSNVLMHHLRKVDEIFEGIRVLIVTDEAAEKIRFGRNIDIPHLDELYISGEIFGLYDDRGQFLALARRNEDGNGVTPFKPWNTEQSK